MKVFIAPNFKSPDRGEGGIRRVVEAQRKYLPDLGVEVVETVEAADLVAIHAGAWIPSDKPVVAHMHGLYWDDYEWPLWAKRLNRDVIKVLHLAQAISAPSEWVANAVRRAMWCDVAVLHHGISTDEWHVLPKAQKENYVLWNKTRLDPICDPLPMQELAQAMPKQKFVSTYCLEQLNNVTVTGALPYKESSTLVERAGIYLCTTRETFGIGTIEALASGVPVVGWAFGAQPDIVKHKETGWLCKPGDIAGLQEGIEYCFTHMAEMSKAARADVLKRFTWRNAIARYVPLYEAVFAGATAVKPKVSVIIPCYKLEHYLPECLDSVLKQTVKGGVEIIVVDDASPTWDPELESRYADRGIRFIHNDKNLYLAGALNVGCSAASGEYLLALDADNYLAPGTLDTLAKELDTYRQLDIAYGAVKFINPDGTADTGVSPDGISTWPFSSFSYRKQMQHQNQIPSTSMYRRWIWERSGGYRRRYRTGEDADFWCRATSLGAIPAKVTDAVTLVYRQRSDSMSRTNTQVPWEAWYPWAAKPELTPFIAPRDDVEYPNVQAYDPAIVTVVIPVGPGHEDIVVDAVDSVIAQNYQKWSVVVVNDSGRDLAKLPSFVRVISTTNAGGTGPANSRNVGIATVTTPYFLLLDADDIITPDALESFMAVAQPNMYVYSDWRVHETGEVKVTENWSVEVLKQTMFHAVTCLYPTKAWHECNGFDVDLNAWEDYDFLINLCVHGYCGIRVPKPLLQYRVRTGTVREKLYANKDAALAVMRAKWKEEDFMACGGCAQRAQQQQQAQAQAQANPFLRVVNQGDTSDLVQVEFILPEQSSRIYRGSVTGHDYTFSMSEPVQYVFKADVDGFLNRREFRLYTGEAVPV